jgi:hypothetical protein
LVAFPTETVYGIGASAIHPDAIERLRNLKQSTLCRTCLRWPVGWRAAAGLVR